MKVALVYDRVNKWGGAERVLLALHEIWPEAPLFTSVYNPETATWAGNFNVRTSFLQNFPLVRTSHELYPFLMGLAFESFNFSEFDLVVSVTSEFAKAIITKPGTMHVCYCLNPTGYLWSNHQNYFSSKGKVFKFLTSPLIEYLRWYDKIVSARPDRYVSISKVVSQRVKKYYDRESEVVYPPVDVNVSSIKYHGQDDSNKDFFLIVSRLVPNKRIDIAVKAFNELGWPLKIVGRGVEEERLRKMAKGNVEFLPRLTDQELQAYYCSCRALVVPGEEDFGIVAVEAQSFGKPVVSFGAGGALETIIPEKTGWYFKEHSVESLVNLLRKIDFKVIKPEDCIQNSKKFTKKIFLEKFKSEVEKQYIDWKGKNV